ncbi:MAG: hypothetical protein HOW73_49940 [Polyangiaceae bacterium]|nr:hypothetical protein [Polyangiaceae bacterium]
MAEPREAASGRDASSETEPLGTVSAVEGAPPVAALAGRPSSSEAKSAALLMREPGVVQRIACAAFAWSVTVAPFVLGRTGSWLSRTVAAFALAVGVLGPLLVPTRRQLGRHLGISAFLAFTTLVWVLTQPALAVDRLDPVLAAIGSVAWGVFAFSWGEPWRMRTEGQVDEMSGTLRARAQLPSLAVPIAAVGVVAALVLMIFAWRVREPSRALFGHAASIGLGVALVSGAAHVAISRGKPRAPISSLSRGGRRSLLVLVVAAILGGALLVLRSR